MIFADTTLVITDAAGYSIGGGVSAAGIAIAAAIRWGAGIISRQIAENGTVIKVIQDDNKQDRQNLLMLQKESTTSIVQGTNTLEKTSEKVDVIADKIDKAVEIGRVERKEWLQTIVATIKNDK